MHLIFTIVLTMELIFSHVDYAIAKPTVSVRTAYYSIEGLSAYQLKSQMHSKGPNGYWANARWRVWWTGDCRIRVKIWYIYPRWTNKRKATRSLQKKWNRNIANLRLHERGHGRHGIRAAAEIERKNCRKPKSIISKWNWQDKAYDKRTRHGRTQGVVLD